jgi:hypothetical protein
VRWQAKAGGPGATPLFLAAPKALSTRGRATVSQLSRQRPKVSDLFNLRVQDWQINNNDLPDDFKANAKISMNQPVSHDTI